jgi:hypothetical protein
LVFAPLLQEAKEGGDENKRSPHYHLLLLLPNTTMLSRVSTTFARRSMASTAAARSMTTVGEASTVNDALKFSGYSTIDFTISDDAPVYDAVQKFAAFNIGCLVTTDAKGKLSSCLHG